MNPNDLPNEVIFAAGGATIDGEDLLSPLLHGATHGAATPVREPVNGVLIGELIALSGNPTMPLVRFPGQPGEAALAAQSTVDLHGAHIGLRVVLMFEQGDASRPIVMGVLRGATGWPLAHPP